MLFARDCYNVMALAVESYQRCVCARGGATQGAKRANVNRARNPYAKATWLVVLLGV